MIAVDWHSYPKTIHTTWIGLHLILIHEMPGRTMWAIWYGPDPLCGGITTSVEAAQRESLRAVEELRRRHPMSVDCDLIPPPKVVRERLAEHIRQQKLLTRLLRLSIKAAEEKQAQAQPK